MTNYGHDHVIETCHPFVVKGLPDENRPLDIVQVLEILPAKQREPFFQAVLPILKKTSAGRAQLLEFLITIPQDELEAVLADAFLLWEKGFCNKGWSGTRESLQLREQILKAPAEQRKDLIKKALLAPGLLASCARGFGYDQFLVFKAFYNIPIEQRDDVLEHAWPLIQGITNREDASHIITSIHFVPSGMRKKVLKTAKALFSGMPYSKWPHLIQAAANTHGCSAKEIKKQLTPLLNLADGENDRAAIIFFWSIFPDDQRKEAVPQLLKLLEAFTTKNLEFIAHRLVMIAPEVRERAINLWIDKPGALMDEPLQSLFQSSIEIKQKSHHYLLQLFEKLSEDQIRSYHISRWLKELIDMEHLFIPEVNPVFQKLISILFLTDPGAHHDKKNPYRLHQQLKKLVEQEPLIPFAPPPVEIDGASVTINLAKLRLLAAGSCDYSVADLPKGVASDGFKQLYARLKNRLEKLSEPERKNVHKYIQDSFCLSLDELKNGFLNRPLITLLMKTIDILSPAIDPASYYLYQILAAVLDESNTRSDGMLLSPQEELLLRVFCSIQACATGMRDGITLYYNLLPYKYRCGKETEAQRSSEAKLIDLLKQTIEKTLFEVFENSSFIRLACNCEKVTEVPHQALFLKNRLCRQVGLSRHKLTFDMHSGTISAELLNAELPDLMKAFFTYFTAEKLVEQFRSDLAECLKSKTINYMDLYNCLEILIKQMKKIQHIHAEEIQSCIVIDDDYRPLGLTVKGALLLLLGFEVIHEEAKLYRNLLKI